MPGMPQNNASYDENGSNPLRDYDPHFKPNDYDSPDEIPALLDKAYEAAFKLAKKMCEEKDKGAKCCNEIAVKVECSNRLLKNLPSASRKQKKSEKDLASS